ncbi:F-box protein [Sporobolomyces koalae]|uniref:F-box protein n=1 Tax=Sporobolomyces koalae TaxID=500713 RepID=UPI003174DEE5
MPSKKRKVLESDYDSEDEETSRSRRRRTTKPKGRVKKQRRAIKPALNLPLDLVWEICTLVDFCDLFSLSRTCSSLRSMLTRPGATVLFKQARARNEIPELSASMDDLSYAALLFSKNCYLIIQRFEALGYLQFEFQDPEFRRHSLVNCSRRLTERAWTSNVREELEDVLLVNRERDEKRSISGGMFDSFSEGVDPNAEDVDTKYLAFDSD